MSRSHTITQWDPENREQWESGGEKIAKRNLLWSAAGPPDLTPGGAAA